MDVLAEFNRLGGAERRDFYRQHEREIEEADARRVRGAVETARAEARGEQPAEPQTSGSTNILRKFERMGVSERRQFYAEHGDELEAAQRAAIGGVIEATKDMSALDRQMAFNNAVNDSQRARITEGFHFGTVMWPEAEEQGA